MTIQFHVHNFPDSEKEDLQEYAMKRFQTLEKFLKTYAEDNKSLIISIDHQTHNNFYIVKVTLRLAGEIFHHQEETHNPKEAIDKSEANLIKQAKKHLDLFFEKRRKAA